MQMAEQICRRDRLAILELLHSSICVATVIKSPRVVENQAHIVRARKIRPGQVQSTENEDRFDAIAPPDVYVEAHNASEAEGYATKSSDERFW